MICCWRGLPPLWPCIHPKQFLADYLSLLVTKHDRFIHSNTLCEQWVFQLKSNVAVIKVHIYILFIYNAAMGTQMALPFICKNVLLFSGLGRTAKIEFIRSPTDNPYPCTLLEIITEEKGEIWHNLWGNPNSLFNNVNKIIYLAHFRAIHLFIKYLESIIYARQIHYYQHY